MRWTPGGMSGDIEDQRGSGGGLGGRHFGIGGTIVLLILSFVFKQNLFTLFSGAPTSSGNPASGSVNETADEKKETQ